MHILAYLYNCANVLPWPSSSTLRSHEFMLRLTFMKSSIAVKLFAFVVILGLAVLLGDLAQNNEFVKNFISSYGYFALFIVSFIGGLNLFVPVPVIAFMPVFL